MSANVWHVFEIVFWPVIGAWAAGLVLLAVNLLHKTRKSPLIANILLASGTLMLAAFIGYMWVQLERPPMRTLGETRLWYSALIPFCGLAVGMRWRFHWLNFYTVLTAALFLFINYLMPETHDRTLMPALQSPWFIPHVVVYMIGYALLGASSLAAFHSLLKTRKFAALDPGEGGFMAAHKLAELGFIFLTAGLLFGGLWAKTAWGHYWTWDPKETWALLTFFSYLVFFHLHFRSHGRTRGAYVFLAVSFIVLLLCWFGVNYLPAARSSVHTYQG
ncbi:MAG: hypothetical protein A2583_05500 [Bdellovibrionales bacterium RIFOXYD1_FULL_53_11]|nr:MAG: hypothetical protein A2583_05500 [Bdellovibrionales bacterium RIFOXYD1_FULL_53_11]